MTNKTLADLLSYNTDFMTNTIKQAFEANSNPPLFEILSDENLINSIKTEYQPLMVYLSQSDIVQQLISYSLLTDGKNDSADNNRNSGYVKCVNTSVYILSANCRCLQEKLNDDDYFINSLQRTLNLGLENDLKLCGHFQRIFESFVRFTNGGFLSHFPKIFDFLIDNIYILALRELVIVLMTEFSEALTDVEINVIFLKISKKAKFNCSENQIGENRNGSFYFSNYFAITAIRDILNGNKNSNKNKNNVISIIKDEKDDNINVPNKKDKSNFKTEIINPITDHLIDIFQRNDEVLFNLFDSVTINKSINKTKMFEAETFRVLSMILSYNKRNPQKTNADINKRMNKIIDRYSKLYDFNKVKERKDIDCGIIEALNIFFKEGINYLMPFFFIQRPITLINAIILENIKNLHDLHLRFLIDRFNLSQKIYDFFNECQSLCDKTSSNNKPVNNESYCNKNNDYFMKDLINGHVIELAILLDNKRNLSSSLQTVEWNNFVDNTLKAIIKKRGNKFGSIENEEEEEEEDNDVESNELKVEEKDVVINSNYDNIYSYDNPDNYFKIPEKVDSNSPLFNKQALKPTPSLSMSCHGGIRAFSKVAQEQWETNPKCQVGKFSSATPIKKNYRKQNIKTELIIESDMYYLADPIDKVMVC